MKRRDAAPILAAVLVLAPLAAVAAKDTTLGAEYGQDRLDNDTPDWHSTTLSLTHGDRDSVLNLEWRRIGRFGRRDDQWVLGGHAPVTDSVGLGAEVSGSADPTLLPQFAASFDVDVQLPAALVAHLGGRRADYPDDTATTLSAGLEYYLGAGRLAYSLINARLQSGDSGTAHVLNLDWYYRDDGSRVGLVGAVGDEATRISPAAVTVADVRSAALAGRHWLGRSWGATYAFSWTEQGDFYTRTGGTLGFLFRF